MLGLILFCYRLFHAIEIFKMGYGVLGALTVHMLLCYAMHALKQPLYRETKGKEPNISCLSLFVQLSAL